jgi:hypothetical protein
LRCEPLVAPLCATLIWAIAATKIANGFFAGVVALTRIVQREMTMRVIAKSARDVGMVDRGHGETTKISIDSKTTESLKETVADPSPALTALAKRKLPTPKEVKALRIGRNDD